MRLLAWSTGYSVKQVPNLLRYLFFIVFWRLCFFGQKCIILLIGELYQIMSNYIKLYRVILFYIDTCRFMYSLG